MEKARNNPPLRSARQLDLMDNLINLMAPPGTVASYFKNDNNY